MKYIKILMLMTLSIIPVVSNAAGGWGACWAVNGTFNYQANLDKSGV